MLTVEDRLAIQELYARYNWAIDTSDGEAFAATFTPDGRMVNPEFDSVIEGTEPLAAFARDVDLGSRGLQHWNTNLVLDADGPNAVRARLYMFAAFGTKQPVIGEADPVIERLGRYEDRLVKDDAGEWRFAERVYTSVYPK